jgi:hypothetical protein
LADASSRLPMSDWSLSSADQAMLVRRRRRPAPSTRRHLGDAKLILFIRKPLPCSNASNCLKGLANGTVTFPCFLFHPVHAVT